MSAAPVTVGIHDGRGTACICSTVPSSRARATSRRPPSASSRSCASSTRSSAAIDAVEDAEDADARARRPARRRARAARARALPRPVRRRASSRSRSPTCATPTRVAAAVARHRRRTRGPAPRSSTRPRSPTTGFVGFADFLVRAARRPLPRARHQARPPRARHRAAAARGLRRAARPARRALRPPTVELLLGDGTTSEHRRDDIAPGLPHCAARGCARSSTSALADDGPVAWGDPALRSIDGRCATCELEVQAHRDLLLVGRHAGHPARRSSRRRHHDDRRARRIRRPGAARARRHARRAARRRPGCSSRPRLRSSPPRLRASAHPTIRRCRPPVSCATPRARRAPRARRRRPVLRLRGRPALHRGRRRPAGASTTSSAWSTPTSSYTALWAHSLRRGARGARAVPRLRAAAPSRAPRHAHLPLRPLRAHAPARRWPPATASARPRSTSCCATACSSTCTRSCSARCASGRRSYSIKKLEPLYMGDEVRTATCRRATTRSPSTCGRATLARRRPPPRPRRGARDPRRPRRLQPRTTASRPCGCATGCSTSRAAKACRRCRCRPSSSRPTARSTSPRRSPGTCASSPAPPATRDATPTTPRSRSPRPRSTTTRARRRASGGATSCAPTSPSRSGTTPATCSWSIRSASRETQRVAQRAAAEQRPSRDPAHRRPRARHPVLRPAARSFLLYECRRRSRRASPRPGPRATRPTRSSSRSSTAGVVVEERGVAGETWSELPIALTPGRPADHQRPAASRSTSGRRRSRRPAAAARQPRHRHPAPAPAARHRRARAAPSPAATTSTRSSPRCAGSTTRYLAVQGPPGTGKTYVGSHVIARLVASRLAIGVVAQSHAVVENMLDAVVGAGLGRDLVGKAPKDAADAERFTLHGASPEERRAPSSPPTHASHGLRRRRHRVGLQQRRARRPRRARPARHRRGRAVLARLDDRRLASRPATCCCSATRSSCRR